MDDLADPITVRLPLDHLKMLEKMALEQDATVGHLIRKAVAQFVAPTVASSVHSEQYLRMRLERAVKASSNWAELAEHLKMDGLELYPKGGGLALRNIGSVDDLCKASALGFGYSALIKKFQSGMPGHSHHWLPERILKLNHSADDEALIEPL